MKKYQIGKKTICMFRYLSDNEMSPYEKKSNAKFVWVRLDYGNDNIWWRSIREKHTSQPFWRRIVTKSTSGFMVSHGASHLEKEFHKAIRKEKLNKIYINI